MKYQIPFKIVSEWIKRITNSWTETSTASIAKVLLHDIEHHIMPAAKSEEIGVSAGKISMQDVSGDDYCSTY